MSSSRPPPSPSRRASAVALPSGPPPATRRRSSLHVPRRASMSGQPASSSSRQQHYADIPIIDSDEGSVTSEQLPPPPRTLSRRASTVTMQRTGLTPKESDEPQAASHHAAASFGHFSFPADQPAPQHAAPKRVASSASMPMGAGGAPPRQQQAVSYSDGNFYDPSIPASAFAIKQAPLARTYSQSPPHPLSAAAVAAAQQSLPAPAPALLPPSSQNGGAVLQANPLRNPHVKVSGVEFYAPLPRLQATTEHAADRTRDAVFKFMEQLCPERAAAVQNVMDQFSGRETLLMEAITSIFGDEWASHRKKQGSLLVTQAAENDIKAIMPVALRHNPKSVHTTDEVLDANSPFRLRIDDRGRTSTDGSIVTPALPAAAPYQQQLMEETPRYDLPSTSTRKVHQRAVGQLLSVGRGSSPDNDATTGGQHPIGINNSRPATPMMSLQRSGSGAPSEPVAYPAAVRAVQPSSGTEARAPPQDMDPVLMVMATPSSGGIRTPSLPDELVYQPVSQSSAHWRR